VGLLASAAFYATNLPERGSTLSNSLVNSGDGFSSASVASRSLGSTIPVTPPAASARTGPSSSGSTQSQGLAAPLEPTAPSAAGPAAPPPDCDPFQSALYCVYEIKQGDTLFKIADKFGFKDSNGVKNYDYLIQSNLPDIVSENDVLLPGQKVRIPRGTNRILHTVLTSDTLAQLADQYGSSPDEIAAITENNITDRNSLAIGKEILIPNPTRLSLPSPSATATAPRPTATVTTPRPTTTAPAPAPTNTAPPPVSKAFVWPVTGRISSYFGPSHPLGIDIDLYNNPTAAIGAAKSGVVTFAGGNACCSYGYYVVVDHGDGDQTLYAHFSSISVSVGQSVAQGQRLGIAGRTGYATGIHLHFEVTRNGIRINPLSVLP
jgi:murein DD-endopeptidase MepM/ murein hydrolase activator NlpD